MNTTGYRYDWKEKAGSHSLVLSRPSEVIELGRVLNLKTNMFKTEISKQNLLE